MEGILRKECDNFNTFSQQHNSNFTYNNNTNNNINNDNDVNNDQSISLDYTDSNGDVINIDSYRNTFIFILVIISHGAKNHIYGTDGYGDKNLISIETIQGIFSSTSCPALAYKPKPSYPSHEATNNVNWRAPKLNPEVKVKRLLSNKPIETDQGKVIQQPEVRSTLNKELWFLC
ncbi:hypothetical protein HELRODRAFT_174552 [Helobdella robusta]|uniref:Caspase family p20 domain-containing protein n=1 Tax=Helobdella robusta TaxID=6412 RepID=T1F889_HELRO|nr:hypothetical protein HELRODRAFT_174552 [Helobdella robusta]ESO01594.1 hypothetical protein HELRODRAFT_174552 [Helobdella robusta]